jgi:hypothetical protein
VPEAHELRDIPGCPGYRMSFCGLVYTPWGGVAREVLQSTTAHVVVRTPSGNTLRPVRALWAATWEVTNREGETRAH